MMCHIRLVAVSLLMLPWLAVAAPAQHSSSYAESEHVAFDTAWLNWLECSLGHCDQAMLERFQEQNSGNAAVWMPNVSAALHTKDWRAVDAALEKMASGTHFDDGIYAHTRAGVLATLARGLSSDVAYAKFEAGLAVWPSYANDVSRACKSRSTSDSEMRKTCVRIGKLMQASGSLRDREIGDEVIVENAAAPSERSAAALDRGKVEWQERQLYDLELLPDCDHALARLWVAALHKSDSYADMATIILDARGISLTPPQGWKLPPPQAPPPPYTCSQ